MMTAIKAELQANGRPRTGKWTEVGTSGLEAYSGFVHEAYRAELRWPTCWPLYQRIWRSDPEVTIARQVFGAFARQVDVGWTLPDEASEDDQRAQEFGEQALDDLEGGIGRWLETCITRTPFFGWCWWEDVPGLRRAGWRAPGGDDVWRSRYDDGLVGTRRLAYRSHSSLQHWDMDDDSGRLNGMVQLDVPNPAVTLPLERSVHVTFGDPHNPEGVAALEALWRLERLKYGLEVVQGIGFEHAAGYLNVETEKQLTTSDKSNIKQAARAIMSAQEGNYAAWPSGFKGELKDVPFTAAPALLEAIRYYGILKLGLFQMEWLAIASLAGTGAYSARADASTMFLNYFNAMVDGFVQQLDDQWAARLFARNADAFPGMTERPRLTAKPIQKAVGLDELGQFMQAFDAVAQLGDDDVLALRQRSGVLPETLPLESETPEPEPTAESVDAAEDEAEDALGEAEMSAPVDADAVRRAVRTFGDWARVHEPELAEILQAPVSTPLESAPELA